MITERNIDAWIVFNRETGKPIALDKASGGYPYEVDDPRHVHYFDSEDKAVKYANYKFAGGMELAPARAGLVLSWKPL